MICLDFGVHYQTFEHSNMSGFSLLPCKASVFPKRKDNADGLVYWKIKKVFVDLVFPIKQFRLSAIISRYNNEIGC